jgi:hypothetical protein
MKNIYPILFVLLLPIALEAQNTGVVSGQVINQQSKAPVVDATVSLAPGGLGTITDSSGRFRLAGIPANAYTLKITRVGFNDFMRFNVLISSGNEQVLTIELEPGASTLDSVVITGRRRNARAASIETPLSVQKLTTEEIRSNPGGNFDISRVIQSLPGVGGTAGSVGGYRNDIIIRGGAPNENVYYLDGIEVPVINHFATQGSAGGPTGILNVSFIDEVKLSSSAFDARYDNALSSVFQFRQKNGTLNKTQGNLRLSATELAATLEGPLSRQKKITYLASVRRSYLQLLFSAIDLPIRPNYWDFQTKINYPISNKLNLSFIGIGAIDEFSFAAPKTASPEKLYVLNSNPSINQNSYTVGLALRKSIPKGFWNLTLSRNHLNNHLEKFEDNNQPAESEKTLDINAAEIENKLRFEVTQNLEGWKISYGAMAQLADYRNTTFNIVRKELKDDQGNVVQPEVVVNFRSPFGSMLKMGAFLQVSKRVLNNRLGWSAGLRVDRNDFTDKGRSFSKTLSPRISASYSLNEQWTANLSAGRYFKIPPYTILGYADNTGTLVNRSARYLQSDHLTGGFEYLPNESTRFTLEGFYKWYRNVPVSIRDGISLSNLGGDFNVLGNEAVSTKGKGKAYGVEFFAQQKLTRRFFGILSYTFYRSLYSGADGRYLPSSWDNRHLLSITWGYKFGRNWELGLKFRFQGGAPYTPFDEMASRLNYLSQGTGILNYAALNSLRLGNFHSSDLRIDKKWNFRKTSLDLFLDISNWYAAKSPAYPQYTFQRNAGNTAFLTTDGQPVKADGSNAIPYLLKNEDATVLPTLGFIVEF